MAAALRRSELVALDMNDIAIMPDGLLIMGRKSETDQETKARRSLCLRAAESDLRRCRWRESPVPGSAMALYSAT